MPVNNIETPHRRWFELPNASRRAEKAALSGLYFLGAGYVVVLVYLCVLALHPSARGWAPSWLEWFGAPGSALTILVTLALPVGMFALSSLSGRRAFTGAPVVVLAAMATSAIALGMASYWFHNGAQAPFFAPLAWTLGLFVGNVEYPYSDNTIPAALELARLLAIATTLTTALAAALTLFRSQLDRIAIWRARSLIVIVGVDDETVSMIRAIAHSRGAHQTLVLVTGNADQLSVTTARELGARIRIAPINEPLALADLRLWKKLDRLYLLSEDPVQNEVRLHAINTALDRVGDHRIRLPLTVRIDDPGQAEVWRRSCREALGAGDGTEDQNKRWVADAVGRYEISAGKLVRHLTKKRVSSRAARPADTVLLCGLSPLTYALTSEFAQLAREHAVYAKPDINLPSRVVIIATDADGFVNDHQVRQNRMAPGEATLPVLPHRFEPTAETIGAYLADLEPSECAVILADPALSTNGTRLAATFPTLRIYQASNSTAALPEATIVGKLYPFPINMDLDENAPQDAWERAAELIHERYSADSDRETWIARRWCDLDPFVKQSNRRQVVNTLWLVEKVGQHTWNTLENPDAAALPANFAALPPIRQLEELGFNKKTVDTMIRLEHEDWYRFYDTAGWKHAPTRHDEGKRHNRLLPWADLLEQDQHRAAGQGSNEERSQGSLAGTLIILRSLGYRSVPKSWRNYRRLGEVDAVRQSEAWKWETVHGETMSGDAGDWRVTDAAGNDRSVKPEVFHTTHELIDGTRYRRAGTLKARRGVAGEHIVTLEGDLVARHGDWIVEGAQGEQWAVPDEQFLQTYAPAEATDA